MAVFPTFLQNITISSLPMENEGAVVSMSLDCVEEVGENFIVGKWVKTREYTVLHLAANNGHHACVQEYLQRYDKLGTGVVQAEDKLGRMALCLALKGRNKEAVALFQQCYREHHIAYTEKEFLR